MKTTVILAIYNGHKYLLEQLNSILEQTVAVDEVLLYDDCSNDDSGVLVQNFLEEHQLQQKWNYHLNEKNLGYAGNFHQGFLEASHELVFFCDQDDIWLPDRIDTMKKIMEQNQKVQLLCSEYIPFYTTADAPQIPKNTLKFMTGNGELQQINLNYHSIFIGSEGCTMCVRKSFLQEIEKFWFLSWAHDEFVWKMALCKEGCYFLHRPTLKRRLHSENVSKRKMRDLSKRIQFFENLYKSHIQMMNYAIEQNQSKNFIKIIKRNIKSVELRIGLMRDRKISNYFLLLFFYSNCFHSRKSLLVEPMLAIRGK